MITELVHGHREDKPSVLGEANGEPAIQVYATGLYEGIRKGVTRWVTGTKVQAGLDLGAIVEVESVSADQNTERARVEEHNRATTRDHVATPPGASFERPDDRPPVPEASEIDVVLAQMSKRELYAIAQDVDLKGRTGMDKTELYEHLRAMPDIADFVDV